MNCVVNLLGILEPSLNLQQFVQIVFEVLQFRWQCRTFVLGDKCILVNIIVIVNTVNRQTSSNLIRTQEALLAPPEAAVTLGGGPVAEQLRPEQRGVARDVAVGDTAVLQQRQGQCYVICICQTSGFLSFKS